MSGEARGNREFTLPPGTYVYVQDGTNGRIKTHVGPTTVTLTNNDAPIVYDGRGSFKRMDTLEAAVQRAVVAPEGFYINLMNPAEGDTHPPESEAKIAPNLRIGHKVVVKGPKMLALWPGQSAQVVRGHHLRSNQYLLCRVYNEEHARANWNNAVVKRVENTGGTNPQSPAASTTPATDGTLQPSAPSSAEDGSVLGIKPQDLNVGKLLIVKGTDVSFYIPPTGVSVLRDENKAYVRDAVTLEQLEYCVLVEQNGNKRIPRGPAVVFPTPTEEFMRDERGDIKYRAIELNEIQGIHIKVTKSYTDPRFKELYEGQEIFITGKEYPIYYPREEHALIRYDGKPKHFAVAVPAGDGRYVMDRLTGAIRIEAGPQMLLPNPVNQVIVRRPLSDKDCVLWYPGNEEALSYNRMLREMSQQAPTTRAGAVSEGEVSRRMKSPTRGVAAMMAMESAVGSEPLRSSLMATSRVGAESVGLAGDEISRSSTYTAPRTLTLSSKFEGVPKIAVWTGYAVMVVNSAGDRKVLQGPIVHLMEYDETLEILTLSTGKPKTTDSLLNTPYLLVANNKVSDVVEVETSDFVRVAFKLSYVVNFEGEDPRKWFAIKNYVKFLCDHMRSTLKGAAKRTSIEALYADHLEFVRKVVLGGEGGYLFDENGMRVVDVEVLKIEIPDTQIASMLQTTQREVVATNIKLNSERRAFEADRTRQQLAVEAAELKTEVTRRQSELEIERISISMAQALRAADASVKEIEARKAVIAADIESQGLRLDADLEAKRKQQEQDIAAREAQLKIEIEKLNAEAAALVQRFSALSGGMSEALLALSSQETMAKIAEALSVQKLVGGKNVVDVLSDMFKGTGLDAHFKRIGERASLGMKNGSPPQLPAST